MLFSVGERVAVRMRMDLFQSLMQQDVSFFDMNKTGELVNRYYDYYHINTIYILEAT